MADPHILTTLRSKRDEIERIIRAYEQKIDEARADLAHVNATLKLFEDRAPSEAPIYTGMHRLFKRGELFGICRQALANVPDGLDTRELASAAIRAKGLDEHDKVLRKTIAYHIIHIMRMRTVRGEIAPAGKRKGGVRIWQLPRRP